MLREVGSLDATGTFLEAPQDVKAAKSKWVFDVTLDNEGNIKFKVRLVLCGYSQIKGINYDQTYAPTIMKSTIFMCLTLLIILCWVSILIDVATAFLLGKNDFQIYMLLPKLLVENGDREIVEVVNSLYGEKQAALLWYLTALEAMQEMNFSRSVHDNCLFLKHDETGILVMLVCLHVDDFLAMAKNHKLLDELSAGMLHHFKKTKIYAEYQTYLGMQIDRMENESLRIHQTRYVTSSVKEKLDQSKDMFSKKLGRGRRYGSEIPMSPMFKVDEEDKADGIVQDMYEWAGTLRYLADRTRPDILVALGLLSSDLHDACEKTVMGFERLVDYVMHSEDECLHLRNKGHGLKLFGFCDSSFNYWNSGHSRQGGCLYLGPSTGAFHCFSNIDQTTSHSSTESEVKVIDFMLREIVQYRGMLAELGFEQTEPTVLFVDSRSAVELVNCLKSKNNLKHISMKLAYIREMVNDRVVEICFIPGENNVADILTKPLPKSQFLKLREWLLNGIPIEVINDMISNVRAVMHNKKQERDFLFFEELVEDEQEVSVYLKMFD